MAEPWRVAEEGVGPEEGPDSAQLLCAYMAGSVAWLGRAALSCLIFRQLLFEGMILSSGWMPGTALHFPSRPLSGVSAPTVSPSLHQPHPPRLARSGSASCLCVAPLGKTPLLPAPHKRLGCAGVGTHHIITPSLGHRQWGAVCLSAALGEALGTIRLWGQTLVIFGLR